MYFQNTQILLDYIGGFLSDDSNIKIESTDERYKSDIIIIEKAKMSIEVLEDGLIVYVLFEHIHFDNYTNDDADYMEQAKDFLRDLFTCRIKQRIVTKGKSLIWEELSFVYDDNTEYPFGRILYNPFLYFVPLLKKDNHITFLSFDRTKSEFIEIT